jgi:hypothetical protein
MPSNLERDLTEARRGPPKTPDEAAGRIDGVFPPGD